MAAEQQLVDYIKKAKEMGQADDQTRTLLTQNGWTAAEIGEAFSAITVQSVATQPQPVAQPIVTQQPQIQPQQPQPVIQPEAQPQIQPEPQQPQIQYRPQPQYQNAGQNMMPIESRNNHTAFKLSIVLIILIIIAVGGYFVLGQPNLLNILSNSTNNTNNIPAVVATATPSTNPTPVASVFVKPSFAQYNLSNTSYTPALPEYQIALSELANLSNFQKSQGNFSATQQTALTTDNFFVAKNSDKNTKGDDWTYLYGKIGGNSDANQRQPENSVFITTDFLAHTYNKLISTELSNIEINSLYPSLTSLSKSLLSSSVAAYNAATAQNQKDSYERLSAYFLVTSSILDNATSKVDTKNAVLTLADSLAQSNKVSDTAKGIAKQEIGLIFDANASASSPLMGNLQGGLQTDYTKFNPTGYYAQNAILRDYFRAMSFYGNMNFLLSSAELTRDATNISQLLTSDQLKQWESIYQPESFFAGQGNDLSVYEFIDAAQNTGFNSSASDDAAITKLQSQLVNYQNPQVSSYLSSQSTGFRFMGQMLSPDEFIFSHLTQADSEPDSTTNQVLPKMPTGLMVSTLLGSKTSSDLLNTWVTNNNKNSDQVLANNLSTLKSYLTSLPQQKIAQNAFWSSLYTAQSLFTDSIDKTGYPMFAKSSNWDTKNLQTFLGSWTEAKHSNLIAQGQSSAINTTNTPTTATNSVPKGYVEPNINFLDKLIALVNMTSTGLNQYGLASQDFQTKIEVFKSDLMFYKSIAVAELQNQNVSDSDFEKLRLSAGQLDSVLQPPSKSALISNVFTDTTNKKNLYEADGVPNYIYVAVKDANGTRLTKGLVYSYYEFTSASSKNYTDSTWQGWEYSTIPQKLQMPWWTKSLIP